MQPKGWYLVNLSTRELFGGRIAREVSLSSLIRILGALAVARATGEKVGIVYSPENFAWGE